MKVAFLFHQDYFNHALMGVLPGYFNGSGLNFIKLSTVGSKLGGVLHGGGTGCLD